MSRKVIIDCDPGIDDAVALCLALFDPRLDVVAVTAAAGNVSAAQSSRNVQAIIEQLDPPRFPRLGAGAPPDDHQDIHARHMHGDDGLGNSGFATSQLHNQHAADKIINDELRSAPDEVTVVCLGPLTNLARAFQRDPGLPAMVDRIIMVGGTVNGVGNVTPSAEFNMYFDPASARSVFNLRTTKTLIPLDVTSQVQFTLQFIEQLPSEQTRAGAFLRRILPFAFRSHHQSLGLESISLHDAVALLYATNPELFTTEDMAGDIEEAGELTRGATVFDRRSNRQWRVNMEVATAADGEAIRDSIIRGLDYAGQRTR